MFVRVSNSCICFSSCSQAHSDLCEQGQGGVPTTRSPENVGSTVSSLGYLDPKYLLQMLPEKTGHMVASQLRLRRKGLRAKLIPN